MEEKITLKLCQSKYLVREEDRLYSLVTNLPVKISGDHLVFEVGSKIFTTNVGESWELEEEGVHYFLKFYSYQD